MGGGISDMCKYLMNLALIDHEFVEHRSSEITSACLLLSRYILQGGNGDEAWTPGLIYYTGYKRTQLDNCVRRLATKLLESDMSEYLVQYGSNYSNIHENIKNLINLIYENTQNLTVNKSNLHDC